MISDCTNYVIYSDFDRTFNFHSDEGVKKNIDAIMRFRSLGGCFSFATGRGEDYFAKIAPYFKDIVNAPMIYNNGAYIVSLTDGEVLFYVHYDCENVKRFMTDSLKEFPELHVNVHLAERKMLTDPDLTALEKREWLKAVIIGDPDIVELLKKRAQTELYGEIGLTNSSPRCLEFMPYGVSKGRALDIIRDYYRCRYGVEKTVIAIGDYNNDIEMLQHADFSAAPENASDEAKKNADMTVCHCDEGAVADLIGIIIDGKINKPQAHSLR